MCLLSQNSAGQPQEQVTDVDRHGPLDYFLVNCKVKTILLKTVIILNYIASSRFLQLQAANKI